MALSDSYKRYKNQQEEIKKRNGNTSVSSSNTNMPNNSTGTKSTLASSYQKFKEYSEKSKQRLAETREKSIQEALDRSNNYLERYNTATKAYQKIYGGGTAFDPVAHQTFKGQYGDILNPKAAKNFKYDLDYLANVGAMDRSQKSDILKGIDTRLMESADASAKYYSQYKDYDDYIARADTDEAKTARKTKYQANKTRYAELEDIINNQYGYDRNGNNQYNPLIATREGRQKYLDLLAEKEKLEADILSYERGSKFVSDSYDELKNNDDFATLSKKRDQNKGYRENKVAENMLDASMYTTDANGNTYDVYGNLVTQESRERLLRQNQIQDRLGMYLNASEEEKQKAASNEDRISGTKDEVINEGIIKFWNELKEDEIDNYYYLYNKMGKAEADKYLDSLEVELGRRNNDTMAAKIADEQGLGQLWLTVKSVLGNVVGGAMAGVDVLAKSVTGEEYNPYSIWQVPQLYGANIRDFQANALNDATGNGTFLGMNLGEVYQSVMSYVDSLAGGFALGNGYGSTMGLGAMASTARDLYEQGATRGQIFFGSLLTGIAEEVFETWSLERLMAMKDTRSFRTIVTNTLKGWAGEGSEEGFTEIADNIIDMVVRGRNSDAIKRYYSYKEQGMTDGEATLNAFKDVGIDVYKAFVGGAIAGGLGAGARSLGQYGAYRAGRTMEGINDVSTGNYQNVIDQAQTMSSVNPDIMKRLNVAQERLAQYNEQQSRRNLARAGAQVGLLNQTIERQRNQENIADIENTLKERGVKGNVRSIASAINDYLMNPYNTEYQKIINRNDTVREVYESYRDGKITSVQQRNRQYADASTGIIRNAEGDIDVDATIERNQFNAGTTIADRTGLKSQTFDVDVNGVQTQATVDHIDENGLYLKTTAGDTVLASDVQTDDTTRLLLDNAETFGPQGVKAYLNGYGGDMSVASYTSKFEQMVRRAQNGMLMQDAVQMGVDSGLRESVAEAAYYVGVNLESYRPQSLSEEVQQNIIEAAEGVPVVSDMQATNEAVNASDDPLKLETPVVKGNASYYVDTEQMSEEDRDQMEMVAMYLDSIHRKVDFVPKIPVIDPKTGVEIHRSGANAQFSEANNGYTVNTNMMGKAFLPIVMHETIHDIAKNAPAEYKIFRDEIIKYIGEDRIKEEQQKLEDMGLGVASKEVEIIANSAASILDDDQTLIEFSKRFIDDKEKRNAFINLLNKLKEKILEVWHYVRNKVGWTQNQQLDYLESRAEALSAIRKAYFDGLEMIKDKAIREEEQAVNQLRAEGIMLDRESDTFVPTDKFYSVATMDDSAAGIREYVNQLVKSGVPKDIAARWIRTQIRAKRFVEENDKYLNFKADARYTVFKSNSEYPQGSVDFNNNCPRREAVTQMFDRLQRQYPNRKFTRVDMENIRQVLKNAGVPVTCGICFVEDRRQRIGETAEQFINQVKSGKLAPKFKATIGEDRYIPNFYDLTTYDGATDLYYNHPNVYQAFIQFNGAKGQAAVRLIEGMAEYRNQIMQWNRATIKSKNDHGGLRMFSVSDANPRVLLDLIQIITDSAAKGLMIQGYTKKPWFAAIAQNTGVRLLLSNIPAGQGWETVNGKDVLKYDLRDGINQSDKWYKRITNWRYIGRNIIGINEKQIRLAMADPNIDQIIPFHSSQAKSLLKQKNLDGWYNYKYTQTPKYLTKGGDIAEAGRLYKERCLLEEQRYFAEREYGKQSPEYKEANRKYSALNRRLKNEFGVKAGAQINIYTDVIEKYNTRNKREFVESYLKECEERQYIPVFAQFLDTDENGKYIYTEGYHKFLVDYKLFDEQGNIIPQSAVFADFNDDLINEVLTDYVKVQKMADEASGGKLYDEKTFDEVEKKVIQNMDVDLSNVTSTEPLPNSSYYSIDPDELNAEYMEAVNNNALAKAQEMVTAAAERSGLHTVHMFHGSLNNSFTVFDKAKANTEGNSGAGFYFTTNPDDAEQNYAMASGADNFFKISALADMLEEDGEWDGVEIEDRNHALQLAEEILNRNPEVKDVFLQYDHPYVRDFRNSTNLYDEVMADFDESIVDREDYDSDEDYEEDLYRYRDEHYYEAIDRAVRGAYFDMENTYEVVDGPVADDIISKLIDETYGYDSLTWSDIHKAIDAAGDITVFKNDEAKPEWASAEMTRAIIENLGYDAIIDREVSQKFGQLNRNGLEAEHIIVFKPNQIKLADTVTYDNNGNVIPLTERFDMSNNDVRYSVNVDSLGNELSEQQVEYFKDSQVRDEDGKLLVMYHGTDAYENFTVFKKGKSGYLGPGIYLSSSKAYANRYASKNGYDGRVYTSYVNITNPLIVTSDNPAIEILGERVARRREEKNSYATTWITNSDIKKLQAKGYDGIIWKYGNTVEVSVWEPNQIKNTDNKTPTSNPDIRYSVNVDSLGNELSEQQQEYFKDSKARDEAGRLLVMYHGTRRGGFTIFDPKFSRDNLSLFFSDNRQVAEMFTYSFNEDVPDWKNATSGIGVYPVYLNIKNPLIVDAMGADYNNIQNGAPLDMTAETHMRLGDYVFLNRQDYNRFKSIIDDAVAEGMWESVDDYLSNPPHKFVEEYANYFSNRTVKTTPKEFFDNYKDYSWRDLDSLLNAYDSNSISTNELRTDYEYDYEDAVNAVRDYFDSEINDGALENSFYTDFTFNALPKAGERYQIKDLHNTLWYAKKAEQEGYDGVIFHNLYDAPINTNPSTIAVAFDSNQVKDIDNKAPTDNADIRYSVDVDSLENELSKEQQEYFAESKVRDDNGRLLVVYHGTPNGGFTVFDRDRLRSTTNAVDASLGFHFTDNKGLAEDFASNTLFQSYLNITKPFSIFERYGISEEQLADDLVYAVTGEEDISDVNDYYDDNMDFLLAVQSNFDGELAEVKDMLAAEDARNRLIERGYDGVILPLQNTDVAMLREQGKYPGGNEYIVFDSNQIKNTDNKNPTSDPDIRYSIDQDNIDLSSINEANDNNLDNFRRTLDTQYRLTIAKKLTPEVADKLAGKLIRSESSEYDRKTLANALTRLINTAADKGKDLDIDEFMRGGTAIVREALLQSKEFDAERYNQDDALRKYLNQTKIKLTSTQVGEAKYLYGSIKALNQTLFGSVVHINNTTGTSLDVLWSELSQMNPVLFPADANEGDMVEYLERAAKYLKRSSYYTNVYTGMDADGAAAIAFGELIGEYTQNDKILQVVRQMKQYARDFNADVMKEANRITKERAAAQKQIVEDKKESLAKYRDTVRQGLQVYDEELINYNSQQEQLMQEIRRMQPGDERFDAEQNLRALRDTIRQTEEERRQYEAETRQRAIQMAQDIEDATKDYLKAGGKGYTYAMDVRQAKLNMMNKASLREQKEQAQKRTVINTIRRNANNLMNRLLTSSDTKHVPENLRLVVAQFLNELDLGFRGPETRMSIEWLNRLHLLAKKMQDHNAANGTFVIDDMIIEQLVDIADDMNTRLMSVGRNVDQMSLRELQQLSDTVSLINAAIYNSDRLLSDSRKQRASALAERSITEMGTKKQRKYTKGIMKMLGDFFAVDQLDSFSFAERLGSDFNNTIFKNLRKGFDKKVRYVQQGNEAFAKALRQLSADERTAKRILKTLSGAKAITNTFTLENGQTITLTPAQVMSLYLLNKRPDARRHIYNGGLTVEEYNGVKKQEMIQVNEDEVKRIIDTLTPEQRAFADSLQKFAASSVAEWGNDVSLTLWGIKKFTDKDYWKIKVDSNTLNAVAADKKLSENVGMYSLKNLGSSKQINPQATNPLIIDDIVDGFVEHVDEMSSYGAYTVPLDDAMKWYNYRNGNRTTQRAIENYMGVAGKEYFVDFIKALNSSQSNAGPMPIADKLIANAKIAAISANARVVIQQPSAYARAMDVIAPKYLLAVNPLQVVQAADRARKYSSIALWKGWGYRDVMVGKSLRDNMVGDSSLLQKINDVGGYLAGKADDITWGALWLAVEAEVKDKNPSLKAGTNDFYEAVADRFSDVIDRTQVVDSPFHRSKAMRSKNALWKMYTSFMSEPTKSYNMFVRAFSDIHQNGLKGQTAKRLARTAIAFTAATVLNSILASAIDMLRDDDDDKDLWEKYLNANAENIIDGLNPLNLIPVGKELMSIIDGYSPSRMDLDAVDDLIQVGKRAFTLISGENKKANPIRIIYDGLSALSKVVGIPIGNALRAVDSIGRLVGIDILPKNKAWASSKQTAGNIYKEYVKKGVFTSELVDKYVRLKADEIETEELARIKAGESRAYMSPEDVERYATNQVYNDFAKLLAENDDTIRQAYEAKIQGDSSVVSKIKKTFTDAGVPGEVFDKAVLTYANSVKETDPKSVNELDARLYSNDDLVAAIVNGYDADDIYQEIIADSNAQDPEKSVQDDTLRELYQYYQQYILEGNTAKAEDLKETTQDVFDLEESRFSTWNSNVEIMRFQQEVPEADEITATAIKDYNENCAAYGIDKSTYYDAFVFKQHTGGEVGANGKSIPFSKCVKIMAYIDGLPLTPEQKTALASCWYKGTTLEKYKRW